MGKKEKDLEIKDVVIIQSLSLLNIQDINGSSDSDDEVIVPQTVCNNNFMKLN